MNKRKQTLDYSYYFLCGLVTALFVYRRGQDLNWDLLNYHYYQGFSLLHGKFIDDIAAVNLQSFMNPSVNLLSYLFLTQLTFPSSALTILIIQLTSIPGIALLAKDIAIGMGNPGTFKSIIPAVTLSLLAPLWWSELGTSFYSSWTAPFIIWGVYLIFGAYKLSGLSKTRIAIAGILFGMATGLKLTNAPFAIAGFLMIAALLYRSGWRASVLTCLFFIAGCGIGFSPSVWWYWHLWSEWGSPFFPLYNGVFKSKFFDFVNFRDMRWHFSSFKDVLTFIVQSVWGTTKTSEVPFADPRYLFATMLAPVAMLSRTAMRMNRQLVAFMLFMASSFFLWVFIFAYQRYLIPFELLLGLLVWILVARIVDGEGLRNSIMVGLSVCDFLLIKVPDWGHGAITLGGKNPFSIEMNERLHAAPARYLVVGAPIGYVLPSFHIDSIFYGVGMSKQVDDLIFRKLKEVSKLPLRILAKDEDAARFANVLKRFGYDPLDYLLECEHFGTRIGRYIVCDVLFQNRQPDVGNEVVSANFSANEAFRIKGILWDRGLSVSESWGRWSDGDQVEFGLSNCLPQGKMKILMIGHAFGPNEGLPVKIIIGKAEIIMNFSNDSDERTGYFENDIACNDKLVMKIPKATSPVELGMSPDSRKLGIGFISMKIIKE